MTDYFANDSRTNRERMMAGDWYIAKDPTNAERYERAVRLSAEYLEAFNKREPGARDLLVDLIGDLGEGAEIRPPLYLDYGDFLTVGEGTFINFGLVALDVAQITIGRDCQIGPNVQLLTPIHPIAAKPRRDKIEAAKPITLGDNVWLGGGVIVCPGVNIGDNTVVGAGAVVTKDLPANVVAVGNPATVIKQVEEEDDSEVAGL